MYKKLLTFAVVAVVTSFCVEAEAQLFQRARQARQARVIEKGRSSLAHVPLTRIGRAIKSPFDARVYARAERTGRSPEQIRGIRMLALEGFGAALGGAASGLEAASGSIGSYPSVDPKDSMNSSSLPSNFSQKMQWNSFNRSYSTSPYHRAANGY